MIEALTFLEEGKYTQRDNNVKRIAEQLRTSSRTSWGAVSGYVADELIHDGLNKDLLFRKRTASQILESGFTTGCTDVALAYIALARELGIPTKYVETFYEPWLKDANAKGVEGHIFVDVFVNGNWRAYEPKKGFTKNHDYSFDGRQYVEVGKGLDFSEVYLKENGVYRPKPMNLQSLDEAVKIFKHRS